ncbi:hypothetical protein TWF281_000086 [Arthrobotrys megalospora]
MAIFPNIHRVEVNFAGWTPVDSEPKLCAAIFSTLSTLERYDNITHFFLARDNLGLTTAAEEEQQNLALASIKPLEEIRFPARLQSVKLDVQSAKGLLPLMNYEGVNSLGFKADQCQMVLVRELQGAGGLFLIKTLTFYTFHQPAPAFIRYLPEVFPNIESLVFLIDRLNVPGKSFLEAVPRFPNLRNLVLAWPRASGYNLDLETLEKLLETELGKGKKLQHLEKIEFRGARHLGEYSQYITATCTILRDHSSDPPWTLSWHKDTVNYEDEPGFQESLQYDSDAWEESDGGNDGFDRENDEEDGEYDDDYFEYLGTDDELYLAEEGLNDWKFKDIPKTEKPRYGITESDDGGV